MMLRQTLRTTAPRLARGSRLSTNITSSSRQRLLSGISRTTMNPRNAAMFPVILDKAVMSYVSVAELNIPRGFGVVMDEDDDGT